VVARTAAFLLLNDSKSSFRIDGDSPATTPQHDGGRPSLKPGWSISTTERLWEKFSSERPGVESASRIVIGDDRFVRLACVWRADSSVSTIGQRVSPFRIT
jgi:hypothetical protein